MALAKTTRPTVANTVARSRLFRLLDRSRKRQITWVWGPPGVGKTTLIASYLVSRKLFNLWYQVDDGDADIATFFYFLGLAAPRRRPLPFLTPEYRQGISVFTRNFFRELYNRLKTPFVLVFDNYQEVSVDSPLHEVMREVLAEIPLGGHVIFISRSEPPPVFARLRAQRAIEILDWPQLRFTQTEATGLVRKLAPGRWSKNTINRLHRATDGWAAGLVLSLEQLRSESETSEKPQSQSYEVLFDYFAEEIFKKTDPETQDVLLQTAFVPRVTATMAEKLTGHLDAGQILANLHKQNYFTNKLGVSEATYEYHPLFREFLLAQADRTYASARLDEIRRIAAGIIETAGQVEVAAGLLHDAKDWEGLARLICRHAPTLLGQGRGRTVEEWLAAIPETLFEATPWLLYWRGICELGNRHAACQRDLERAFIIFREQRDATGIFSAWSTLIISLQGEGNATPTDYWVALLDELLQEIPEFPSVEIETRVAAAMLSAIAIRQPGHPDGARWAERALSLTRRHSELSFRAITALNWCYYHYQLGDCAKAATVAEEMRAVMRSRSIPPVVKVIASMAVTLHELAYAIPSYRETVSEMLDLVRTTGVSHHAAKHSTLGLGITTALSNGDLDTVDTWIQEIERDLTVVTPAYRGWSYGFIMRTALLRGDVDRAAAHQPEMLRSQLASGAPLFALTAHLISADLLDRHGEEQEARAHIEDALEIARSARSPYFEFMARVTEAYLNFHSGKEADGLKALKRAMELGRAGGFVNSFVWQPPVMAELCAKALEAGIEVEYVQGLIRKRRLMPKEAPVAIESWPWPIKIYTLGRFEVFKDDEPLHFKGKVQRKPLALLKAIIAFGGQHVREETLIDTLWPDAEGDAAHFALTSAIHRLRRLLGHEEAIIRKDNDVSLDDRYCWIDAWAVEQLLTRSESSRVIDSDRTWAETIRVAQRAAELYQGPFLGGDGEAPLAAALGDRIRRQLLRQLLWVGQSWEEKENLHEAARVYEEAVRVDPCAEDVCRSLMNVYRHLGRPADVVATYDHCRKALAGHLGTLPSAQTETLLERARASSTPNSNPRV